MRPYQQPLGHLHIYLRLDVVIEMSYKVQTGGMFNSYKAQYNPETHKLLKVLMDEVKLTTALRQRVNESLKRGEPLPVITRRRYRPSYVDDNLFGLKKNYYFQRRTQSQIMHSGAYERERYRFLERTVDLEKEKEKLRNIMEYGKKKLSGKKAPCTAVAKEVKKTAKDITPEERLYELVCEVEDRLQFLKEMEALKQSKAYEPTIKQEIAGKLREMRKIDRNLAERYRNAIQPIKNTKNSNQESDTGK